jgi:D-serine deaminase-like pyridoxal phosphate-dependent protein
LTFIPEGRWTPGIGERVQVVPAHCDPTIALHERFHLVRGDDVIDQRAIDRRHW